MSSTLFSLFDRLLLTEESLQFTISRGPNGTLTVLLQPVLKASTETMSDEMQSLRAALATPLYLSLTPAELDDAKFDELVRATAAARAELRTNIDALMLTLREANKSAKSQTTTAQKRGSGTSASTTTAARAPAKASATAPVADTEDTDDDEEASDTSPPASSATETTLPSPAAPSGAASQKEPDLFSSLNAEVSAA